MRIDPKASMMTVPEMRDLLGIRKTDSYWLIHKNLFVTETVAGQLRVDKKSFEEWYESQTHYRKVNGPKPGRRIHEMYYTIREAAEILGLNTETFREQVLRQDIATVWIDNKYWISRFEFEAWYSKQTRYRKAEDRLVDQMLKELSITVPDMGRMLGIDRREAWKIINQRGSGFVLIRVADRPRVTLDSFEQWYQSQNTYVKLSDRSPEEQKQIEIQRQKDSILQMIREGKELLSDHETAICLGIDDYEVRRMISDYHELAAEKHGKTWFVPVESLYQWLSDNGEVSVQETTEENTHGVNR